MKGEGTGGKGIMKRGKNNPWWEQWGRITGGSFVGKAQRSIYHGGEGNIVNPRLTGGRRGQKKSMPSQNALGVSKNEWVTWCTPGRKKAGRS